MSRSEKNIDRHEGIAYARKLVARGMCGILMILVDIGELTRSTHGINTVWWPTLYTKKVLTFRGRPQLKVWRLQEKPWAKGKTRMKGRKDVGEKV